MIPLTTRLFSHWSIPLSAYSAYLLIQHMGPNGVVQRLSTKGVTMSSAGFRLKKCNLSVFCSAPAGM